MKGVLRPMVSEGIEQARKEPRAQAVLTRARIRAVLRVNPPELTSSVPDFRPAAVLVPIVDRGELSLLFTRRTEHLPSHAGQICFPGGRVHADDATLIRTALREMEEEIGLPPD